jgi:hypothetical protein
MKIFFIAVSLIFLVILLILALIFRNLPRQIYGTYIVYKIRGEILDGNGKQLTGEPIVAYGEVSMTSEYRTDAEGKFLIIGMSKERGLIETFLKLQPNFNVSFSFPKYNSGIDYFITNRNHNFRVSIPRETPSILLNDYNDSNFPIEISSSLELDPNRTPEAGVRGYYILHVKIKLLRKI